MFSLSERRLRVGLEQLQASLFQLPPWQDHLRTRSTQKSTIFLSLVSSPSPPSRASGVGRLSRVLHKVNVDQFLLLRQIRLWLLRQQRHDWEVQDRLQRLRTQMLQSTMQEYQKHNATATRLNARLLWKSQSAVLVTNKCKKPTRSV